MKILFSLFVIFYALPPFPILGLRFHLNYLFPIILFISFIFLPSWRMSRKNLNSLFTLVPLSLLFVSINVIRLDISESLRYIYFPVMYLALSIVGRDKIMQSFKTTFFSHSICFLSFFVFLLSLFQYLMPSFSRFIPLFYGASSDMISSLSVYNRITGIATNPSDSALFALNFILLILFCYVCRIWKARKAVLYISLWVIVFFLSQSRTLMLGLAAFPLLISFFNFQPIKKYINRFILQSLSLKASRKILIWFVLFASVATILMFLPYVRNSLTIVDLSSLMSTIVDSNDGSYVEISSASIRFLYFLSAFGFKDTLIDASAKVLDSEFLKLSTLSSSLLLFAVYLPLAFLAVTRLLRSVSTSQQSGYLVASSFCFYTVILASFSNFVFSNLLLSPLISLNLFLFAPPLLISQERNCGSLLKTFHS